MPKFELLDGTWRNNKKVGGSDIAARSMDGRESASLMVWNSDGMEVASAKKVSIDSRGFGASSLSRI